MKVLMKIWLIIGLTALGLGIILTVIVSSIVASGASINTYSYNESYEDVESLDFSIDLGKVIIKEGNKFSIDAQNLVNKDFSSYVKDGTWIIEEEAHSKNLLGIDFTNENILLLNHGKAKEIIITLPKDFIADEVYLKVCAGHVDIDKLQADKAKLVIDAGLLEADYMDIYSSADFKVDIGELRIENVIANNINADCSVGKIYLSGDITGDNNMSCDIGAITLDLEGEERDYLFDVDKDIANVMINGERYRRRHMRNNYDHISADFDIECDIGSITINTN